MAFKEYSEMIKKTIKFKEIPNFIKGYATWPSQVPGKFDAYELFMKEFPDKKFIDYTWWEEFIEDPKLAKHKPDGATCGPPDWKPMEIPRGKLTYYIDFYMEDK